MRTRRFALVAALLSSPCAFAADPWTPAPPATGSGARVAITVEGASGELAEEIEGAARDSLFGTEIVDAGAVRSARSFGGVKGDLDDAKAEQLRKELAVDRLLVVQVREEAGKRFLVARAVDAGGVTRKYAEASEGALGGSVRDLVAQLPPAQQGGAAVATGRTAAAPRTATPAAPRPKPLAGTGPYVNLDVLFAQKQLDHDDWRPVADQFEVGLAGTFGGEAWPIHLVGDLYRSSGSDSVRGFDAETGDEVTIDVSGTTTEVGFGVRKIFVVEALRPHIGGGLALVRADVNAHADGYGSNSDSDTALGPWLAAGAMFRAGRNVNIGMLVRWSSANVDLNDVNGDAGGLHFGVTIGAGFGSAAAR